MSASAPAACPAGRRHITRGLHPRAAHSLGSPPAAVHATRTPFGCKNSRLPNSLRLPAPSHGGVRYRAPRRYRRRSCAVGGGPAPPRARRRAPRAPRQRDAAQRAQHDGCRSRILLRLRGLGGALGAHAGHACVHALHAQHSVGALALRGRAGGSRGQASVNGGINRWLPGTRPRTR